jgi:inosose dehydratase
MGIADRLAGALIARGVCEVPGWGWQLDSTTVLWQMQVPLVATEFGPEGFLPDEPQAKAKTLADHGLVAVTGTDGYDLRPVLGDDGWQVLLTNLDRFALVASRMGITVTVPPQVATMVETVDDVERLLASSGIGLCRDTGHLLIGGADPGALAAEHAERIRYTHLKDVDATWARRVQSGEVTYTDAVPRGMYRRLGQGGLDTSSIVGSLERVGYDGWYVKEQDAILDGPAATGPAAIGDHAPMADVRASNQRLFAIAQVFS